MEPLTKRFAVEAVKYLSGIPRRKWADQFEAFSEQDIWTYQGQSLLARYADIKQNVPYYRDSQEYPDHLAGPPDIRELLASLPVLRKDIVKAGPGHFRRTPHNPLSWSHTTGGTTGTPLRVHAGLLERGTTNAILEWRNRRLTGKRNPRVLRLSGYLDGNHDGPGLVVPGTNAAYLSIYSLAPEHKGATVDFIKKFRPEVIHGYASALGQLAQLVSADDLDSHGLTILSTSETLTESARLVIEERLAATVYNEYGSQEGQHLVLECESRSLHIHPGRGIVEILNFGNDEPAPPGELGRVVVTGLIAKEMPLLRYDIGDSAISTGHAVGCACGLEWPTIGTVYGRTEDLVKTRDGRRIGLLSHSTLKDLEGVREAQIIQHDYEMFEYLLWLDSDANRSLVERHIRNALESRIGTDLDLRFTYTTEAIPRTTSGKLNAVVVKI